MQIKHVIQRSKGHSGVEGRLTKQKIQVKEIIDHGYIHPIISLGVHCPPLEIIGARQISDTHLQSKIVEYNKHAVCNPVY